MASKVSIKFLRTVEKNIQAEFSDFCAKYKENKKNKQESNQIT